MEEDQDRWRQRV